MNSKSFRSVLRLPLLLIGLTSVLVTAPLAQGPQVGPNVNMVSGTAWPGGDPFLQRQNEGSIATSTRNPRHLLAGANDYRTVDLPGVGDPGRVTGDAWLGVFKSFDGGMTWQSTLLPGYPQDPQHTAPLSGYEAGADPTVRAGTNGLFYYSGIVFDRTVAEQARANDAKGRPQHARRTADSGNAIAAGTQMFGKSAVFVSRFIDNNNRPNGDAIDYIGATIVKTSDDNIVFNDKPWLAVDIPRLGAPNCTIPATANSNGRSQTFRGGRAYVTFTEVETTSTGTKARIMFSRSTNCGATWSTPKEISVGHQTNQGSSMAINPLTGEVYVTWRRFKYPQTGAPVQQGDAIMVAKSSDGGNSFTLPIKLADITPFEQGTSFITMRTNAYPTITLDYFLRVYVAWSNKGMGPQGDARIVMSVSDGRVTRDAPDNDDFGTNRNDDMTWSLPLAVDNPPTRGHQIMPTMSFAAGKLMLAYYDLRQDHTQGVYTRDPISGTLIETREAKGHLETDPSSNKVFSPFLAEKAFTGLASDGSPTFTQNLLRRHTIDVVTAQASPGDTPVFTSSRASRYRIGSRPGSLAIEQMQYNPPLLPMFACGASKQLQDCRPFFSDYIDLSPSPAFRIDPFGVWIPNVLPITTPVFHAMWTDNRDVRPPPDGNWANYTPPNVLVSPDGKSLFDPTVTRPMCTAQPPGFTTAGMRNQNVYTARIGGLYVTAHDNSKQLGNIQRAFAVTVQNATDLAKTFRLTLRVGNDAVASFQQFQPLLVLDVSIAPRSSISRPVFVTSTNRRARVHVDVTEIDQPGGSTVADGLTTDTVLNPDITNPDITNPDITNEVYNPDITNPDITNPDITNPDITNPDITNPDITNPDITNPDITNPDITNPDITNPDITNPDITNPDITNPDITNGSVSDTTWEASNGGTTSASYSLKLLLTGQVPSGFKLQLILHRIYTTPMADNCDLGLQTHNVLVANIRNPAFTAPADVNNPDITNPDITNATFSLAPGERLRATLRVVDPNRSDAITFNAAAQVSPVVLSHAVNTADAAAGITTPPSATPNSPAVAVSNTNNSGPGSLRAAILSANAHFGLDTIAFNIPGPGPHTILLASPLPAITSPAIIDGTTQPGWDGAPIIDVSYNGGAEGPSGPGLAISAGDSIVRGLVIRRFKGSGIVLTKNGRNRIEGNYIGTDVSGLERSPNVGQGIDILDSPDNIIGGGGTARNVISANAGEGILIAGDNATGNLVEGNFVGTSRSGGGTGEFGNAASGIYIRRARNNTVRGNIVAGNNGFAGVAICGNLGHCGGGGPGTNNASGNIIQGNSIGVDVAQTALGNAGYGVSIDGTNDTQVGGTTTAAANVIANNAAAGVVVFNAPAARNTIRGNSIHSNGGLGIDLGGSGVTANDAGDTDTGANDLQNFPVITSVSSGNGTTNIRGTFNSKSSSKFVLEFFSNGTCDGSGHGEGATFIGATSVTTDNEGNASFDSSFTFTLSPEATLTGTATDPAGNTSEFSACNGTPPPAMVLFGVNSNNDGLSVIDPATGVSQFRAKLSNTTGEYATPVAASTRPNDDVFYVWNNSNGTSNEDLVITGVLLAVNACTAKGTPVDASAPGQGVMGSIAFSSNGVLFAAGDALYRVNPETGLKQQVGPGPWTITAGGMDFNSEGTLYAVTLSGSELHTVNTSSGTSTLKAPLTLANGSPANVGTVGSIVFTPQGILIGSSFGANGDRLFDIDPATGVVSNLRSVTGTGGAPQGMDFALDCPAALLIRTKSLRTALQGVAYRAVLRAAGGQESYTWSIIEGSLPAGLTLDSQTGVISGTPTGSSPATFTVKVEDASQPVQSATRTFTIVVAVP